MKTMLSLGCLCAAALLVGCGDSSAQKIEANQVRPPAAAPVDPPGKNVKLGSNNMGGAGAGAGQKAPPAPKDKE